MTDTDIQTHRISKPEEVYYYPTKTRQEERTNGRNTFTLPPSAASIFMYVSSSASYTESVALMGCEVPMEHLTRAEFTRGDTDSVDNSKLLSRVWDTDSVQSRTRKSRTRNRVKFKAHPGWITSVLPCVTAADAVLYSKSKSMFYLRRCGDPSHLWTTIPD